MSISPARGAAAAFLSLLVHAVLLCAAIVIGVPRGRPSAANQSAAPERILKGIVWIAELGRSDKPTGGGGSGNRTPAPPGRIELPGNAALTVPVGKPPAAPLRPVAADPADVAAPVAQLDIAALDTAAGTVIRPGAIDGVLGSGSLGPGTGGRAGSGDGSGEGPGRGPGRGPGSGGGEGGGPKEAGTPGLREPTVLREVKPVYTAEAMRAKVQGTAVVECVVLPDGTVGDVEIVKSLDPTFGLDREAAKAARKWLFQPATLKGQPVAMRVSIALTFALR